MNSNKRIIINPEKQQSLAHKLKQALSKLKPERSFMFNKYKNSITYSVLSFEIEQVTKMKISPSTLCNIITLEHNGIISTKILGALELFIDYVHNFDYILVEQSVLWGPDYGFGCGIFIDNIGGEFIKWQQLKKEIETQVISGCPRLLPVESEIRTFNFYKKKDHIVRILDNSSNIVGDVWLGKDPEQNFVFDGLVRIGKTISDSEWMVYQVYRRYSDNSYRLIKSNV